MSSVSQSNNALLSANNICFHSDDKTILDKVSLQIERGHITTLIGPNGAGKSTLVKILLGLQKPSSGDVSHSSKLVIGYMPQKIHVDENLPLSVFRFLQLANKNKQVINETLKMLSIEHLKNHAVSRVSGGEMQRVLLSRALLNNPDLLILDEPVQGVDIKGQMELYKLINQAKSKFNCGILMISHDLHLVMSSTDHVVCLNQHICCQGHPDHISKDPAYLALFSEQETEQFAVYTHHHDHDHDMHGNVVCNHDH